LETDYVIIHKSAHDLFIIPHVLTLSIFWFTKSSLHLETI